MNVQSKSSQWLRESTQRRSVFGACAKTSQFLIEDFSLAGALLSAAVHPRTSLAARQHQSHDSRGAHCCTVINWFSSVELRWPWLFGGRLRQRDPSLSYGCAGLPGRGARNALDFPGGRVLCLPGANEALRL